MKHSYNIDIWGTAGLFLTAIFSPCCFPIFAFVMSTLGLGSFELFGGWIMWIFQAMVLVSLAGFYLSYRKHRNLYPLLISIPSAILILYGYHVNNTDKWPVFLYVGMAGLFTATVVNYHRNKLYGACNTCASYNGKTVELKSTIRCPHCEHKKEEIMPTNSCQFFYQCEYCRTILKPKQGDCCVYCSYGSVKCPPIQAGENCC